MFRNTCLFLLLLAVSLQALAQQYSVHGVHHSHDSLITEQTPNQNDHSQTRPHDMSEHDSHCGQAKVAEVMEEANCCEEECTCTIQICTNISQFIVHTAFLPAHAKSSEAYRFTNAATRTLPSALFRPPIS
ncbi:hypothetical protein [Alteromonas ponticola]|uniref:CopL family metal-binding regulatory protein n=1 Tax=Alteromonas ponticola TaxID=2720613 RepID=A0ABX1R040_9ALTE|nr:hypothetical protein [Alteromonas ponticola]NMH59839.1 hypothetical protein [Alteromonas ponticola]